VSAEKTKHMLMSCCQKAGQRQSINIVNRSFEDVAKFKSFGTALTDQNCMHEEFNSRLNLGNACYHFVQTSLTFCLLSRNVNVKIYSTIIVPVAAGNYNITSKLVSSGIVPYDSMEQCVFCYQILVGGGGGESKFMEKKHSSMQCIFFIND
jgi:hypothetical protein